MGLALRDAVLHDLVSGPGPWATGRRGGTEFIEGTDWVLSTRRTHRQVAGLPRHIRLAAWTALGATLFLLQVISQTPPDRSRADRGVE